MDRRTFLRAASLVGLELAFSLHSRPVQANDSPLAGMRIANACTFPCWAFWPDPNYGDTSQYTMDLEKMHQINMVVSSFAHVGALSGCGECFGYDYTVSKFYYALDNAAKGHFQIIRRAADIPDNVSPDSPPGAIFHIHGGGLLENNPSRLDDLYGLGIRQINLLDNQNYPPTDLGDCQGQAPRFSGMSDLGKQMVERMEALGMIVDVAHATSAALTDICEICTSPVIDSHTSPSLTDQVNDSYRQRSWYEIEQVAKTGGMIATWPFRMGDHRATLASWAREIKETKDRIGIEHIGLGTDGVVPPYIGLVSGYSSILNLADLAQEMLNQGLSIEDIKAFMGGNYLRILGERLV